MPKSHPPYPAEFREQSVELARAGRTTTELAREFGCSTQAVRNRLRGGRSAAAASGPHGSTAARAHLHR